MRPLHILKLLAISVFLGGCASQTPTFHDANMDFGSVKTVAVLPFANLTRDNLAPERVRDVFGTMLLGTGSMYVLPAGEVMRGISRTGVVNASAPSAEEIVKLGALVKADGVLTGVVREYGEVRSGSSVANVISVSLQLAEAQTGRVVWSGSSTKGGIGFTDRLLGGGGEAMNRITEQAINELLDQLFK
jgi:polysaccharide biosynthesis protein PelC